MMLLLIICNAAVFLMVLGASKVILDVAVLFGCFRGIRQMKKTSFLFERHGKVANDIVFFVVFVRNNEGFADIFKRGSSNCLLVEEKSLGEKLGVVIFQLDGELLPATTICNFFGQINSNDTELLMDVVVASLCINLLKFVEIDILQMDRELLAAFSAERSDCKQTTNVIFVAVANTHRDTITANKTRRLGICRVALDNNVLKLFKHLFLTS